MLSASTFGALIIGIDNLRRLTVGTPITVDVKRIGWRPLESSWMLLYDNNFTTWISHLLRANGSKCNHPETVRFEWHARAACPLPGAQETTTAPLCGTASWVSK